MTPGQIYADARARLTELFRSLPPEQLTVTVPACPAWTVRDMAAHLVGGPTDLLGGVYPSASMEDWTAVHVASRTDRTLDELLEEWAAISPKVEAAVDAAGGGPGPLVIVADILTHEQDVRAATGNPGARDTPGIDWALQFFTTRLAKRLEASGAPSLRIVAGKDEWYLGPSGDSAGDRDSDSRSDGDEPATTLHVDGFELFRGLIGRRSERQIRAWQWTGDPSAYLPELSPFPFPVSDLAE